MSVIYAGTITVDPEVRAHYIALRIEQTRTYRARKILSEILGPRPN